MLRMSTFDMFAPSQNVLPIQASFGMTIPQVPTTSMIIPTVMECPEMNDTMGPILAIKRTYQPSVLRRKRKFGFRVRKASLGGRKVLNNRFLKGRKRLSL
ncbi:hypothetical protein SPRG_07707 [Saprolegnia parasitica CBS 223.65]|uniref:Large ribosomal subunit protein bL34m n=1 Tax=Saprolegnia parasitica (strain CBS 223.65) TaxID=695850 RepID=A0A067C887_SAPPC|nr:hypothetical protein SPRG_07707 [Saprolegnia parasitica CBS 223.65]KDO26994.1 hypothetical protein SPRG_07707 [Saprolegnia parasitica CBS 223.65]|eukprot:XP_012202375.1 hypothetical protein SPRG_07707 [Saprolegnia parasitica CBS 223.65]